MFPILLEINVSVTGFHEYTGYGKDDERNSVIIKSNGYSSPIMESQYIAFISRGESFDD